MDPEERKIGDKDKLQKYRDQRLRRNAKQTTYPNNPILYGKQQRKSEARPFNGGSNNDLAAEITS